MNPKIKINSKLKKCKLKFLYFKIFFSVQNNKILNGGYETARIRRNVVNYNLNAIPINPNLVNYNINAVPVEPNLVNYNFQPMNNNLYENLWETVEYVN